MEENEPTAPPIARLDGDSGSDVASSRAYESLLEQMEKEEAWKLSPLGRDKPIPTLLLLEDCLNTVHAAVPLDRRKSAVAASVPRPSPQKSRRNLFDDKVWGERPPLPSERNESENATALRAIRDLKAEVRRWEMEGGLSYPHREKEKFSEHLTDKYLCGVLDPLPSSYHVSRIRREAVQVIESIACTDGDDGGELTHSLLLNRGLGGGGTGVGDYALNQREDTFPKAFSSIGSFTPGLFSATLDSKSFNMKRENRAGGEGFNFPRSRARSGKGVPEDLANELRGKRPGAGRLIDGADAADWGCGVCGKDNPGRVNKCAVCGRLRGHSLESEDKRGTVKEQKPRAWDFDPLPPQDSKKNDNIEAKRDAIIAFNRGHKNSQSHTSARLSLSKEIKDLIGAIRAGGGSVSLR